MITLKNVSKSFDGGKTFVVRDVSLDVRQGETLVLIGSSGCGKSTMLKMVNRLIEPTSGSIEIDGSPIEARDPVELRRSIGYVFQQAGLFPHMTVEENVSVVLRLEGKPHEVRVARARELLELVNLDPHVFAKRFPAELSGGQQQRVGVARALAGEPQCLLMDEPFGALDAINRDKLQSELVDLKKRLGKTILFVTHDISEAMRLGDRIAVMNKGRLEQVGDKKTIINHPATDFVRHLFETQQGSLL